MKKLLSNIGSSTLTIAVVLLIILSSVAITTTLIIGRNANISIKKVNSKYEYVLLENDLYNELIYRLENNEYKDESLNGYKVEGVIGDSYDTVIISNNTYKITATISFTNEDYKILTWSKESV